MRTLTGVAKADGDPGRPGARGSANAMHIGLRHIRQIEINDMCHAIHIDAARGDIGRDQHADAPVLERLQRPFPLRLALIAMDHAGRQACSLKMLRHPVRPVLRAGKNERAAHAVVLQQLGQHWALAGCVDKDDALLHPLDRGRNRGDRDMYGRLQHLAGERRDLFWHRGAEQQRLPCGRNGLRNFADRHDEAEVQHVVRLVQHQNLDAVQHDGAVLHVVHQAAGRGD